MDVGSFYHGHISSRLVWMLVVFIIDILVVGWVWMLVIFIMDILVVGWVWILVIFIMDILVVDWCGCC